MSHDTPTIRPRLLAVVGLTALAACSTSDKLAEPPWAAGAKDGSYDPTIFDAGSSSGGCDGGAGTSCDGGSTTPDPKLTFYVQTRTSTYLKGNITGVSLPVTDDKYDAEPGFQLDVIAETTDVTAGTITVTIDGKVAGSAAVAGAETTIPKITVPCASLPQKIRVEVKRDSDGKIASEDKNVTLNCGACDAQIEAPTGCLVTDADPNTPGFQAAFKVSSAECDVGWIEVTRDADGGKPGSSQQEKLVAGSKNIVVTLAKGADITGIREVKLIAHTKNSKNDGQAAGKSAEITVKLTTEKPTITVVTPQPGKLTLADDANTAQPGLQVQLKGTVTTLTVSDQDKIQITVDGVKVGATTPDTENVFVQELSFPSSKTYKVAIRAENYCGLKASTEVAYQVFTDKAKLTIAEPKGKAGSKPVLLASGDQEKSTQTVYDTDFVVEFAEATVGSTIGIYCRKNKVGATFGTQPVGTAIVTANTTGVSIPVKLDIAVYGNELVCEARDDGANQATSPPLALSVGLPPPCLRLTQPIDALATNAATLPVTVTADHLDGRKLNATIALKGGANFFDAEVGAITNGALSTQVALSVGNPPVDFPDGGYVLTVAATDIYGNKAADSACSDGVRSFRVDRTPPTIEIASPVTATINPLQYPDEDLKAPGYQTSVVVGYSGEPITDVITVCLKNGTKEVCAKSTPGAGKVVFGGVTLVSGSNVLSATATDALGNKTAKPKMRIVFLESDAVTVTLLDPTNDVATAKPEIAVKVRVEDKKVPVTGAKNQVYVNGQVSSQSTITEEGGGVYRALVQGLQQGKNTLQWVALPGQVKEGASQQIDVTYKTALPGATIDNPKDGAILNRASSLCVAGADDCVLKELVVSVTDAADGSVVEVSAACGKAEPVSAKGTVASGKVVLKQKLTLANDSTCTLSAVVTDEAGQTGKSAAIKVTIDRTAPRIDGIASPGKSKLFAVDDVDSKTPGMQTLFRLRVCDVPAVSAVSCKLRDKDGKDAGTLTSKAHEDLSGVCGEVKFGVITLPDGENITLTCTTADAAGNPASATFKLLVLSSAADIRLIEPVFVADKACTKGSECSPGICIAGKCATPWGVNAQRSVTFAALGVLAGADVRVCTKGPVPAGAKACSQSGYKVAVTATTQGFGASVDASAMLDGYHRVYAEVEDPSKPGTWATSLNASFSSDSVKYRSIYIDTKVPAITAVLAPTLKGTPTGCLSGAMQSSADLDPGGKFTFAATMNEAGSVSLFAAGHKLGTGQASANTPVSIAVQANQEGDFKLVAVARDLVGNESPSIPVKTGKTTEDYTFTVDTLPPGKFAFTSPTKSPLLQVDATGDGLDVKLKCTDADVGDVPVRLFDSAKEIKPTGKLVKQAVTYADKDYNVLVDGSHKLTASVDDNCGNTATIQTSPAKVVVDTKPPTATIVSPAHKANFGDGDDEDKNTGGYQVKVTFSTSGAQRWKLELGTDCDANFVNCKNYPDIAEGTVTHDGGNEPAHTFSIPFGVAAEYSIRLTVWDEHGNSAQTAAGFRVKLSGCLVAISGQPQSGILNTDTCPTKGQSCAGTTLNIRAEHIGPCGAPDSVKLIKIAKDKSGKEVESTLASGAPNQNVVTFAKVAFHDGEDIHIEARIFQGAAQKGSSGPVPLLVDLTNPVATFVAATIDGFATPESGKTALWGKAQDADAAKNKHQFHARLQVTDANVNGGRLAALADGDGKPIPSNAKLPVTLSGDGTAKLDIKNAEIGENTTTKVIATVYDAAGNKGTAEFSATVDWIAPGRITLAELQSTDLNPRRPYAKLSFTAVADNGKAGTAATSYEVRYSRSAIPNDKTFDNACDAATLSASTIDPPKDPGKADSVMVEGPDPRPASDLCKFAPMVDKGKGRFYFAVRAVDAAGNKGPISNVVTTSDIRLHFAKFTGNGAPLGGPLAFVWPRGAGDVNGDGLGDFTVGGVINQQLCIVYGFGDAGQAVADTVLSGTSGPHHSCMGNTTTMGGDVVGGQDVNGDGVQDLIVSFFPDKDKTNRKVLVFLGEKGKPLTTTPAVTIEKVYAPGTLTIGGLWPAGNFDGDRTAGGTPIEDFAITIPRDGKTHAEDRVMIVPGSEKWSTASPIVIDIESAADRSKHRIATVKLVNPQASSHFGQGVTSVGNMLPDGDGSGTQYDDLAIGQNFQPSQIVILKGQPLNKEVVFELTPTMPADPKGADAKTVRVLAWPHHTYSFGFAYPVKVSFDGDSVPDLAVIKSSGNNTPFLYWLRGSELAKLLGKARAFVGGKETKKGSGIYEDTIGWWTAAWWLPPINSLGNFFDRPGGAIDLEGRRPKAATDPDGSTVGVRGAFVRPDTGQASLGSYAYEDLQVPNPFAPGKKTFGTYRDAAVGDFNGDGLPDFVVGTTEKQVVLVY